MNAVAASRLRMMLAAGKHRLESKEARSKEERRCRRAERVLERYRKDHGPLTYESPAAILDLARLVAHHRAMLNSPKYRAFIETKEVPLPEKTAPGFPGAADGLSGRYHTEHCHGPKASTDNHHPQRIPLQPSDEKIQTRPSDGKPKRNQAYFEELRTRRAELRAADPEKFERERQAQRIASNRYWDHIRFERAHSNAAGEIAEALPKDRKERYRAIWHIITQSILAKKWLIINAGQVQLYHLRKKQPRVRGVGRAARLAGF